MAERFLDLAFRGAEACQACAEACGLVMFMATPLGGGDAAIVQHDGTDTCSHMLLMLVRSYQYLDSGIELEWLGGLLGSLPSLMEVGRMQCAAARRVELESMKLPPRGWAADAADAAAATSSFLSASPWRDQVAVLVAATPNKMHEYQPFLNLWRCYALRHGFAFILETDDTEVSAPHRRAPNWMRWFAARKHIEFYKALLVVDPDQFIVPECWNYSLPAILGAFAAEESAATGGRVAAPDVATRDFGRPQTLNNGVVLVRHSPRGLFFLDQLLEKAAWMQTIERDQGAFDETVLELLGLEARERGERGYDSRCAAHVFTNVAGNHEVALYALCWWQMSEEVAGPFGNRHSQMFRFADPRIVDVNHVVGARGLSEPALLHHFAGRSKDWAGMLETFGLPRRATADCRKVFRHVDAAAAERACVPGGPVVTECEPPMLVC
eukprot:TRINITY_DN26530_c0_g1_i1.p1 TRINITY_DN26530_c0_g1~~TRINITY_DN26530_c0_g1_i1.p1  ORF type:complete len:439 (-),score=86.85 TRINITY_DN26530_c0_g1_i1:341-1657(-)